MEEIEILTLPRGRVYYYGGNVFQPLDIPGQYLGRARRAIREFLRDNRAMVDADRARPGYLNLVELADLRPEEA